MKHISKKSAFLFIVLFVVFPIFAQVNKNTSSFVLIREMQHNLESGFYTLVLNQADQMDKNYPDSRYSDRVLVYRSECYYSLGMRKLALATLESCPDTMSVNYFYGRLYLDQNNYEKACKYFEKAFAQSKKQDKEQYFSLEAQKQRNFSNAIYYAEVLEQLKDYPKAVGVTLDLIKNAGYFYDGGRATSLLCELFYELGRQDRVCEVYEKIEVNDCGFQLRHKSLEFLSCVCTHYISIIIFFRLEIKTH